MKTWIQQQKEQREAAKRSKKELNKKEQAIFDLRQRMGEATVTYRKKVVKWRSPKQYTDGHNIERMRIDERIWRGQRSAIGVLHAVLSGMGWEIHMMRNVTVRNGSTRHHYIAMLVYEDGSFVRKKLSCDYQHPPSAALNEMFRERLGVTFMLSSPKRRKPKT